MNPIKVFSSLSPISQIAMCLLAGATPLGILGLVGFGNIALLIFLVLAFVGMLLMIFKLVLSRVDKAKGKKLERGVKEQASAGPAGAVDAASRARMDDLRKSWEEGIVKFKERGKDLYSVPWYMMVGESGSGKTEAIRHCNVGFPPGLQDKLQGSGGTMNMHWWFTNQSVIIDTAGRLLQDSGRQEWRQFLKMMRKARPMRPVNGLLLVIPADSLIKDTGDDLEKKGGRIASALDEIQEELGVRFPVYVIVTKCDLINGFREYFDAMPDPELKLQEQMVGWSNPQSLDDAFNPGVVEQHLKSVRDRLAQRRYQLLLDPVHTEDPSRRRIEQVDALYSFPDTLVSLAPRLRRYLEMVFVAGEWSRKPLFIRGIYFTSSMQEGAALDAELAEALGVKVADLQQEQVAARREKTFFLRDVFVAKVFKEFGLVTAAANIKKSQGAQRTVLLATGFVGAALALGLTVWSFLALQNAIGRSSEFWKETAERVGDNFGTVAIVSPRAGTTYDYFGDTTIESLGSYTRVPLASMPSYTRNFAETEGNQRVPFIFKPVAMLTGGDPFAGQKVAHAAVFEGVALYPLIDAVRTKMRVESAAEAASARPWTPEATAALAQLVRVEAATVNQAALVGAALGDLAGAARGAVPGGAPGADPAAPVSNTQVQGAGRDAAAALSTARGTGGVPSLGPLVRYALEGATDLSVTPEVLAEHVSALDEVGTWTYSSGGGRDWKDVARVLATEPNAVAIRAGTNRFVTWWASGSTGQESVQMVRLQRLRDAMLAFDAAERAIWEPLTLRDARTLDDYRRATADWDRMYAAVETANASLMTALSDLGGGSLNLAEMATRAQEQVLASSKAAYTTVLGEIPGGTAPASMLTRDAHPLLFEVEQQLRAGYGGIEQRVAAEILAIRNSLQTLESPLLTRIGGTSGQYAFARRFEMYKAANDQIVAAGAVGSLPPAISVFELKGTLDLVDERVAGAKTIVDRAVADAQLLGDAPAVQTRFVSGAEACRRAIDAAWRKSRFDGISAALADLDDANAMEDMVSRHAAGSGVAPVTLRGLEMTDWPSDTRAEPSFSPTSAKAAFDAVTAAGGMAGASEDPTSVRVLEAQQIRDLVDRANNVMRGYASEYVGYWTEEVPSSLSVNDTATWAAFLNGILAVDARQAGDRIGANAQVLKTALEAIPTTLLDARDQDAVREGLVTARFEIEQTGSGRSYLNGCRDLRQAFQALSSDGPGARTAVLGYDLRRLEEEFLSIFYLPEGEPEERVRYWSSMTLAGFSSLANEANRGARQALVSLRSVRRAFPLCRDATTILAAADLDAVITEVDLVGAAATGRGGAPSGSPTTIGGGARVGDGDMDDILDILRGRGIITPDLQAWFGGVRTMVTALRKSADGAGLTFEIVVLSAEQQTQQDAAHRTNSVDLAGIYPYLDVVRGGSRQRFENDNAGGVLSRVANACKGLPVPNAQGMELWFYRQAQQVADQPADQRGVQRVQFGADSWAALRAITSPGAEAVGAQGGMAQEWRVPVSLPNPQNGAMLQYWVAVRFSRPIPVPESWPTTAVWPAAN